MYQYHSDLKERGYKQIVREAPDFFEYEDYCFGCGQNNPIGLHLKFFAHAKSGEVATIFITGKDYCGFPKFVHGGIIATLLDEVMAYTGYFSEGTFTMTKTLEVRFKNPILIGKPIYIYARVDDRKAHPKGSELIVKGWIHEGINESGKVCSEGTAHLVAFHGKNLKTIV
ncbi:MAG: PaaI family thioesterase [Promethearchaeota archaeon]